MESLKSLIKRAQAGELDAFGTVVQKFQDMAVGYAYSILGDFHLAEDAAQEAFIEAFRCLPSLRTPDAFPSWFRKIVFKHCDRLTRGKRIEVVPLETAVAMPSKEKGPAEVAEEQEMEDNVLAAIAALPEHERLVTTLFYINGYSQNEVADFLGIPVTTVNSRLHHSRKRLKGRLFAMVTGDVRKREVFMSKVTFIEPASSFNGYAFAARLPLMGPIYLGTILSQKGYDVSILNENVSPAYNGETGWLHESLLTADVVGISTITSTADRAYKIADAVREQNKNAKLIIGGPHASFMAQEALEHADIVVKGEAESIICDLVDGNGDLPKSGVVEGKAVEDLESLPIPDIGLLENKLQPKSFGIIPHIAPICTSRGCPYDCTFCSVTQMFGRRYRFNSVERVIEELKIRFKQGFRRFFFYDDNFTASKDRTKNLLDGILTNNLNFSWLAPVMSG